jgi:hypothetical protein
VLTFAAEIVVFLRENTYIEGGPSMRKLISFALQRPEIPLGLALLILLTFTILVAFPAPRNWSAGLLLRSVQTTLTLMLAIDSPANLLQNRSPALVALGWTAIL